MAEHAKSRFHTKIEEIDDGESVMVEAKYFDDLSQPKHLRHSSLLGKNYVVGKVKYSTSTSYLIDFEDGGCSPIAKKKVQKADPFLEDTQDTSTEKAHKISFQIVKNVNTAVETNSAFQSTTTPSKDCITVSSSSNPNPVVLPGTTSTEISISSTSDVSNCLFILKPDAVILQTDYVTNEAWTIQYWYPRLCLYLNHLQILSTLC